MSAVGLVEASAGGELFGLPAGTAEALVCAAVAAVVLCLELQRRTTTGPNFGSRQTGWYAESCKRLLKECAPEAVGLTACLTTAALLRARGDVRAAGADSEAWEQIKAQWPLLLTADTLLSLQAMLRLVVFASVALRAGRGGPAPLAGEPSALWLGAAAARVALLLRSEAYTLDGPLGGNLPSVCEVAVLPILFLLGRDTLRRAPFTLAWVVAAAACFARRNHLSLADDAHADALFLFAHSLEFLASFAYLLRSALIDVPRGDVSAGFAHLLMPVQQALAAYYWLQAFDFSPTLVGAGLPFEALQIGCCAQLGAYLGASALYFAEVLDRNEASDGLALGGSHAGAVAM